MSFNTTLPTENEIATLPVYEIAMDNWDPKAYIDDPVNIPLKSKKRPKCSIKIVSYKHTISSIWFKFRCVTSEYCHL